MLPCRVYLHSAACDDLVDGAEVLHLLLELGQLTLRNVGLELRLEEDIVDLVVLSSSSRPVAQVVVALDPRKDDASELDCRSLAGQSPESGDLTGSQ